MGRHALLYEPSKVSSEENHCLQGVHIGLAIERKMPWLSADHYHSNKNRRDSGAGHIHSSMRSLI